MVANVFDWLNNQAPFTSGANVLQWLTAVPAVVLSVVMWRKRRCRVWRCLRLGQHPVADTTWKVCSDHHLPVHHASLRTAHRERHPNRLGHGESPA